MAAPDFSNSHFTCTAEDPRKIRGRSAEDIRGSHALGAPPSRKPDLEIIIKTVVFGSHDVEIIVKTIVFASLDVEIIAKTTVFASLDAEMVAKTTVCRSLGSRKHCKNNGI